MKEEEIAKLEEIKYPQWTLEGKVAIVTGAGKGMGKWDALGLAWAGADVVVIARTFEDVLKTANEIEAMGRKALALQGDVSDIESVNAVVRKTIETFGKIDILVNNAAVTSRTKFLEVTPKEFDYVTGVNFRGVYFMTQAVVREMIKRGKGGKIINISSTKGKLARVGVPGSVYSGTKGGVNLFTVSLAEELAPFKINVNAIGPGLFATSMTKPSWSDPEKLKGFMDFTPLKTIGTAKDIIGPVIFLASNASDYMTGQIFWVDGGRTVL